MPGMSRLGGKSKLEQEARIRGATAQMAETLVFRWDERAFQFCMGGECGGPKCELIIAKMV